jgi:NACalpha-BTF3-like transcription factor
LREIMAQKDARIRFLERELAEREKEVETMKEYANPPVSEAGDERLRDLERKVRELEALVKGLTEEILDVKSVAMKLSRDAEERRKKPVVAAERKTGATLQAEPRAGAESQPARPAEPRSPARSAEKHPAAPAPEDEDLELIMQTDGTLKPEVRSSSEYIVASTGSRSTPAKGRMKGGKSSERKLFVEQKKRSVDDVIQAEENDTVDL